MIQKSCGKKGCLCEYKNRITFQNLADELVQSCARMDKPENFLMFSFGIFKEFLIQKPRTHKKGRYPCPSNPAGFQNTACQDISCISKIQTGMELRVKPLRRVNGKIPNRVFCSVPLSAKSKEEKLLPYTVITLSRFYFHSALTKTLGSEQLL